MSSNEKQYLATRAIEIMTITAAIKEEVKAQIEEQPIGEAAKKWTNDIVNRVCDVYNSQCGQGLLEADEELAQIAGKIVNKELKKKGQSS